MYAIVEITGKQYKVQPDTFIYVNTLPNEEGETVELTEVLLVEREGNIQVGKPFVEGAKVTAKVVEHPRGDKVLVFHKKRRKGYQKLNGHRQGYTKLQIESI
jgi:large subunit ribosomal protein L21